MSDVFECETCGNADTIVATPQTFYGYTCYRCLHGSWHGFFEERQYSFEEHGPALNKVNPEGGFHTSFS